MRQERIHKTTHRKPRPVELGPLTVGTAATDTSAAQDVLDRIDRVLEVL